MPDELKVRGKFGDQNFDYVQIRVRGCQLDPQECLSDEDVAKKGVNFLTAQAYPSIINNEEDS